MKVSLVGCIEVAGRWICYYIFSFSANTLFSFYLIVFFTRLLSKCLWRNYPFSAEVLKPISRCSMLQKIGMSNFVILKWWSFEYQVTSWKLSSFLGLLFQKSKMLTVWSVHESNTTVIISHFSWNDIYGSTVVKITDRRTWKQNWKEPFDCKLVYILWKTVQDMVLESYVRQNSSSQVTSFWCF